LQTRPRLRLSKICRGKEQKPKKHARATQLYQSAEQPQIAYNRGILSKLPKLVVVFSFFGTDPSFGIFLRNKFISS